MLNATAESALVAPFPGGVPIVSARSPTTTDALVWNLAGGLLSAYDAATLGPLWAGNASAAGCSEAANPTSFVVPIVAGGRVRCALCCLWRRYPWQPRGWDPLGSDSSPACLPHTPLGQLATGMERSEKPQHVYTNLL